MVHVSAGRASLHPAGVELRPPYVVVTLSSVATLSFEEAQSVFLDEDALLIPSEDDDDEDRFIILGLSYSLRLLVVCHCYRSSLDVIRIISARPADRVERQEYNRRRTR